MKKRFGLVLLAVSLLWFNVAAAQETTVGAPRLSLVDGQEETAISLPQPGIVKTTIPFTAGETPADAFLVAALYDTIANRLDSVAVQSVTVEAGQSMDLSVQLPVASLDGYQYQYYLWDSAAGLCPYEVPERETITEQPLVASSVLEERPVEEGMRFVDERITGESGDFRTNIRVWKGRTCRASATYPIDQAGNTRTSNFYFVVDPTYIAPTEPYVTFEVVYFDNGTNNITLKYLGPKAEVESGQTSAINIPRQNTYTWRTARVSVADANFIEGGVSWFNRGAHFCLYGGNDTYIYSVKAYATENAQYQAPFAELGEGALVSQMTYSRGGNTAVTYEGRDCDKAGIGSSFSFDMQYPKTDDKTTLYPMTNVQAEVEITYYDDGNAGDLNVTYHSGIGESTAAAQKRAAEGWQTVTAVLQDAVFDRAVGGHDFAISTDGAELYIQKVTVRIVPPETGLLNFEEEIFDGVDFCLKNGDQLVGTPDAVTFPVTVGPDGDKRAARQAPNFIKSDGSKATKYLYVLLDDAFMYGKGPSVDISVTYYDIGKGSIGLQYNTADNPYQGASKTVAKTNSKTWKTETFRLDNAVFTNGQGAYCADFRLFSNDSDQNDDSVAEEDRLQGLIVSEVTVTPVTDTDDGRATLYLIGDSICQAYAADSVRKGWGEYIGNYLTDDVTVENYAVAGTSTKTFFNTGNFDTILKNAKPGDYLFIQFGHNDSHSDKSETGRGTTVDEYAKNLRSYVQKAWEKGMHPVFLTSIRLFRNLGEDGWAPDDGIDDYRNRMKVVGAELNVPVVDVGEMHRALMKEWGKAASEKMCDDLSDGSHMNAKGADEIAKLILRGVQANEEIRIFQNYIDPSKSLEAVKPE